MAGSDIYQKKILEKQKNCFSKNREVIVSPKFLWIFVWGYIWLIRYIVMLIFLVVVTSIMFYCFLMYPKYQQQENTLVKLHRVKEKKHEKHRSEEECEFCFLADCRNFFVSLLVLEPAVYQLDDCTYVQIVVKLLISW